MTYLQGNADRPISVEEMAREFHPMPRSSISGSASRLVELYPEHCERVRSGVYRWHSRPRQAPQDGAEEVTEMLARVVARNDSRILVSDLESEKLYVLSEFKF